MDDSIQILHGVGEALVKKFALIGVQTVRELLDNFPRRYDDYSHVQSISAIKPGTVTLKVTISNIVGRYVRRGMHITEALASDESGGVRLVWFNQPFRATSIKTDAQYYLTGEFGLHANRMSITSPTIEPADKLPLHTARIVPVYKEVKGLSSAMIRRSVSAALHHVGVISETLPAEVIGPRQLESRNDAVRTMHFPETAKQLALARHRLGFEEVFQLSLAAMLNKQAMSREVPVRIQFNEPLAKQFVGGLPFTLSDDQRRVLWRIFLDMQGEHPMNRLVEGDVGSGKTVVAAMAAAMAMDTGFQVAYMAPTEILARQCAETLYDLLGSIHAHTGVGLLLGGQKAAEKQRVQEQAAKGTIRLLVGTHALFTEKVSFKNLGLIIVDEQHRFGVEQRKKLQSKAGTMPHVLTMTATPIPRSLALTLYGELDISVIHTMPLGRLPILTKIESPNSRQKMYQHIAVELAAGRQTFIVCPAIADGTGIGPSVETMVKSLHSGEIGKLFKNYKIAALHGKMKSTEKDEVMKRYAAHEIDILVATTVIEVGVNVPNATVMIIEGADRFGLAQMHQLRGRVGRSTHQGYCYVVPSDSAAPSQRLRAFASTNDGFTLAELDLEIRGPGALYGAVQHGALDLRVAKLSDTKLIAEARAAAADFIQSGVDLLQYPYLAEHIERIRLVTNLN